MIDLNGLPTIEELHERTRLITYASEVLNDRYLDCDRQGHRKPRKRKNMCGYCHRHLSYGTPRTDALLESRKDLPLLDRPVDAPYIEDEERREIDSQKEDDMLRGLDIIIEELKFKEKRPLERFFSMLNLSR